MVGGNLRTARREAVNLSVGRAERGVLIATEWEVRRSGAARAVAVVLRVVGRSGWVVMVVIVDDVELVSGGEGAGGCWSAKTRSSSAALVCQWKAVRESRARKESGRCVDGWEFLRK